MNPPLPPETDDGITHRELYDAIMELRIALTDTPDRLKDHEGRLRTLEQRVWTWSGGAAVLGTLGGFILENLVTK